MSAVNSSLSDREHEALRRAQRAHEPSMEEILASIRTIIAEERPGQGRGAVARAAAADRLFEGRTRRAARTRSARGESGQSRLA